MSNINNSDIQQEFIDQSRKKVMDYAETHGDAGFRNRIVNMINSGKIDAFDVGEICKERPEAISEDRINFGLGALDDNSGLLVRDITTNPDIIEGILKSDTTGMFIGASKSYKTWHLIRLALSVAHGLPWFDFKTRKSKVLFVNPELVPNEFQSRVKAVAQDMNITQFDSAYFHSLSLHKKALKPDELMDALENVIARDKYELVVLDSIYRLYGARVDENSNSDMLRLLVRMEKMITSPNSAILFSHHSPKGSQDGKRSIDVAAGAGALGRFVATCITTRTVEEEANRFSLEFTSRYHPKKKSVGLIMNGPKAMIDAGFNKAELNGNNKYNNAGILNILREKSWTATQLQKEVNERIGMSKSVFYDSYWPEIPNTAGVTCVKGKYSYSPPSTTTTSTK